MGGHTISIKSIINFRTSHPINEILYMFLQYINGKRKKSHRIKSHTRQVGKKVTGKKVTRKKVTVKNVTIYFFHIYYTSESHSMHNEFLCPYPGYGVYRHFQNISGDMVVFCFIITIYFKFGFILINNNIWSAHTVHTYHLITRTNINLIFELCKLITGKQIGTPQLPKA